MARKKKGNRFGDRKPEKPAAPDIPLDENVGLGPLSLTDVEPTDGSMPLEDPVAPVTATDEVAYEITEPVTSELDAAIAESFREEAAENSSDDGKPGKPGMTHEEVRAEIREYIADVVAAPGEAVPVGPANKGLGAGIPRDPTLFFNADTGQYEKKPVGWTPEQEEAPPLRAPDRETAVEMQVPVQEDRISEPVGSDAGSSRVYSTKEKSFAESVVKYSAGHEQSNERWLRDAIANAAIPSRSAYPPELWATARGYAHEVLCDAEMCLPYVAQCLTFKRQWAPGSMSRTIFMMLVFHRLAVTAAR